MKTLCTLLAAGSLLLLSPAMRAAPGIAVDGPTEAARKSAAREKAATAASTAKATRKTSSHRFRRFKSALNHNLMALLGLEERKAVTSPAKLDRQLHIHQKHLRAKAKIDARARRRRTSHMYS
jgi:hypothetical protein